MTRYKSHIIFCFLAIVAISCKSTQKAVVDGAQVNAVEKIKRPSGLEVVAVNTAYSKVNDKEIEVYLRADLSRMALSGVTDLNSLKDKIRCTWQLQPSSGIKERLESGKIFQENMQAELRDSSLLVIYRIPVLEGYTDVNLVSEFTDLAAAKKFIDQSPISYVDNRVNHRFVRFQEGSAFPDFRRFVKNGDKVVFNNANNTSEKLYLKYYEAIDSPAASPMSTSKRSPYDGFNEISVDTITSGKSVTLSKPGMYLLTDSLQSNASGSGFLVVDDRYPRLTHADELTGPLAYMSTNKEIETLKAAVDSKDGLDKYFLSLAKGDQEKAKKLIKNYYRRISEANELFTNYKEGWRTDKGMIYTIMGPPSSRQFVGQREVWTYAGVEIYFTFYRKPNKFSEDHFELVRYPEYGSIWFPIVEAWRTGNVLE